MKMEIIFPFEADKNMVTIHYKRFEVVYAKVRFLSYNATTSHVYTISPALPPEIWGQGHRLTSADAHSPC